MKKEELTQEQIELKAEQLSQRENNLVTPIVFVDEETEEKIVGYIKTPSRLVKLRVLDKAMSSPVTAASELFDVVLLKDDSDPRFSSTRSEHDKYYLGGTMEAFKLVEMSVNTFKKK